MDHENPLSADELAEIESRCNRATPGPWCEDLEEPMHVVSGNPLDSTAPAVAYADNIDDLLFIGHAREDVPKLIAEIRRLANLT